MSRDHLLGVVVLRPSHEVTGREIVILRFNGLRGQN